MRTTEALNPTCNSGGDLDNFVSQVGWSVESKGTIVIPPNADNHIQATVIREEIQLPRMRNSVHIVDVFEADNAFPELTRIIAHAQPA